MSRKQIIAIAIIAVIVVSVTVVTVSGYDSSTDPLVSLSYINNVLKPQITSEINQNVNTLSQKVDSLNSQIDSLNKEIASLKSQVDNLNKAVQEQKQDIANAEYQVIQLECNDILYTTTSCDIILRSGSATVVSPFDSQGLNDYTAGTELLDGDRVFKNHFLLVPRGDDGRGIKITSADGAYVIVRGGIYVVKAE